MFLKRFKEKSNQKYINKILNERQLVFENKTITSVGVILNSTEFTDYNKLRQFMALIGVKEHQLKYVTFVEDVKAEVGGWESTFNPKDFGWNGQVNNSELETFLNTKFDLLMSYYNSEALELQLATAKSQAKFKIGITAIDERFFDLIIEVASENFGVFQTELKRYLKILNKI